MKSINLSDIALFATYFIFVFLMTYGTFNSGLVFSRYGVYLAILLSTYFVYLVEKTLGSHN